MASTHHYRTHGNLAILFHGDRLGHVLENAMGKCAMPNKLHLIEDPSQIRENFSRVYCVGFAATLVLDEDFMQVLKGLDSANLRYLLLTENGPEPIPEAITRLDIRSTNRVHAPQLKYDDLRSFCVRFVGSICSSDSDRAILDAWWEQDRLVVTSASFERLKIPVDSLPRKLQKALPVHRNNFTIDEYGDRITWPEFDIDMGWPQFEQAVDPKARLRAQQDSAQFDKSYGTAIRKLRESEGLNQGEIGRLTERTVRRIEQGETRATLQAMRKLAAAHKMSVNEYMNEVAKLIGH